MRYTLSFIFTFHFQNVFFFLSVSLLPVFILYRILCKIFLHEVKNPASEKFHSFVFALSFFSECICIARLNANFAKTLSKIYIFYRSNGVTRFARRDLNKICLSPRNFCFVTFLADDIRNVTEQFLKSSNMGENFFKTIIKQKKIFLFLKML